jgi:uncharacterized peroxidase-related enzyme
MAHIALNNDFPGILGLTYQKPAVGRAVSRLAQTLLRGSSTLTPAERELIAAHVSNLNDCTFCRGGHGATASELFGDDGETVACVLSGDLGSERLSPKMRALLQIASRVQESGRAVRQADIEAARAAGAPDDDIFDAVTVAAFFCFANRWVDGMGTDPLDVGDYYRESAKFLAKRGYPPPSAIGRFFIGRAVRKYRELAAGS